MNGCCKRLPAHVNGASRKQCPHLEPSNTSSNRTQQQVDGLDGALPGTSLQAGAWSQYHLRDSSIHGRAITDKTAAAFYDAKMSNACSAD